MLRKKLKNDEYLTLLEKSILDDARKIYVDAIVRRSNDPADFNSNIACLKELEKSADLLLSVVGSHVEEQLRAHEKYRKSSLDFFRDRARNRELKETRTIEDAKKYMLNSSVNEVVKSEFLKEPRITSLNAHPLYEETSVKGRITSNTRKCEYSITFSDDTKIALNDLSQAELVKAKAEFNQKMEQLAASAENTMRPN